LTRLALLALFLATVLAVFAAEPVKKAAPQTTTKAPPKAAPKATTAKAAPKAAGKTAAPVARSGKATAPATKTGARTTPAANRAGGSKTGARRPAPTVARSQPRQIQPSSDRYKEIQAALVQKGYLSGEPTGVWDPDSIDALKRFQEDQKLDVTGKLSARSLISLGLGPKAPGPIVLPTQSQSSQPGEADATPPPELPEGVPTQP
jgi:hypothetical protein